VVAGAVWVLVMVLPHALPQVPPLLSALLAIMHRLLHWPSDKPAHRGGGGAADGEGGGGAEGRPEVHEQTGRDARAAGVIPPDLGRPTAMFFRLLYTLPPPLLRAFMSPHAARCSLARGPRASARASGTYSSRAPACRSSAGNTPSTPTWVPPCRYPLFLSTHLHSCLPMADRPTSSMVTVGAPSGPVGRYHPGSRSRLVRRDQVRAAHHITG
jgi:hypothetical protein